MTLVTSYKYSLHKRRFKYINYNIYHGIGKIPVFEIHETIKYNQKVVIMDTKIYTNT